MLPQSKHVHCVCSVTQSCLALCDPMGYSRQTPLSMGILQTRLLEWVAMPSSRESSRPRDETWVSYVSRIGRQILYWSATWRSLVYKVCAELCLVTQSCLTLGTHGLWPTRLLCHACLQGIYSLVLSKYTEWIFILPSWKPSQVTRSKQALLSPLRQWRKLRPPKARDPKSKSTLE